MPSASVVYSPPAGHSVVTLSGTVETDAQFSVQPAVNDQIVYPSALTVDAQLNISGAPDDYVLWHITAAGVAYHTSYTIENLNAPVLSSQSIDQLTASSMRFSVQTDKAGGTWYVKIGTSMPSDGDTVSTGEDAAVPSAGVLTHTFTGLTASTLYYIKAVHIDADTNVSNYVTASQQTYASGTISAVTSYRPPSGYVVATMESGFDTYATDDILGTVVAGSQIVSPDSDFYDENGDYWSNQETTHSIWHIKVDGTVYHDTMDSTGLSSVVPLDLDDQAVTGCELDTWVQMPDTITIPSGSDYSASVDNTHGQIRVSTDGGSTWGDWTSSPITGLGENDQIQCRINSGDDYANTGPDYIRTANVTVAGSTFLISATNRNAVVPTITVQPQSQSVDPGDPVTLSVTANTGGLADPITYQWRKGGINISGATSSSYGIGSVVLADAGSYSVRLQSSEGGAIISSTANLSVTPNSNVFVETTEGLVDINALSELLLAAEVDYEIWADGAMVLSGTTITDPTTGKLRIESVDSIIGAAASQVELRFPIDGSTYYHAETVTVQAT